VGTAAGREAAGGWGAGAGAGTAAGRAARGAGRVTGEATAARVRVTLHTHTKQQQHV
jgi:hypothetical protein